MDIIVAALASFTNRHGADVPVTATQAAEAHK
jgi:hypothetical protein